MFVKKVPSHPRDKLKRKRKHKDGDNVVLMKKVPSHPRRLRRRTKQKHEDDDIVFVKKVPSHSGDRLKRLQRKDDDVVFVKKVPSHPRDRLRRRTKRKNDNDNDVVFVKKVPPHPRDRLTRLIRRHGNTRPKIELDANALRELPIFYANIKVDETNRKKGEEAIFDKIIRQFPPDNDRFYIEHYKKTDAFRLGLN